MKKGFTLIELLAVIVILAVIALIATPIILNIIEDSRRQAIKSSAGLYIDGLVKQIAAKNMLTEFSPVSCNISNGNITCDGTSVEYNVNGKKPTSGTISFSNGIVSGYTLYFDDYAVTKDSNGVSITDGSGPTEIFNGTFVAATQSDTHKGIVYLNPTDLSATCNAELAALNTNQYGEYVGVKEGCMKFYIYDDTGSDYTMILDHCTSVEVPYDLSYGPGNTVKNQLATDTAGWVGNPDLISVQAVAHIIGADTAIGWNVNKNYVYTKNYSTGTYDVSSLDKDTEVTDIYLDGSGTTYDGWVTAVASVSNKSRYAWLFDNLDNCEYSGCNVEGAQTYGYWTKDATTGDSQKAWRIINKGQIEAYYKNNSGVYSVRPVIALSKSLIN